jgi:hypothetical protein
MNNPALSLTHCRLPNKLDLQVIPVLHSGHGKVFFTWASFERDFALGQLVELVYMKSVVAGDDAHQFM